LLRGGRVGLVPRAGRVDGCLAQRDAHLRLRRGHADDLHRARMRQQLVVNELQEVPWAPLARRMPAQPVAQEGKLPRLVQRDPAVHAVAQCPQHGAGVVRKVVGHAAPQEPALALQRLRQVPVEQRRHRLDAGIQQAVHQPAVEVQPAGVDRAAPFGEHARPRNGEAVRLQPQRARQGHVFAVAVVVVAGDGRRVRPRQLRAALHQRVPDRCAAAVFLHGAFDLVGRGGRSEHEARREGRRGRLRCC
jgi:hypothetical protein